MGFWSCASLAVRPGGRGMLRSECECERESISAATKPAPAPAAPAPMPTAATAAGRGRGLLGGPGSLPGGLGSGFLRESMASGSVIGTTPAATIGARVSRETLLRCDSLYERGWCRQYACHMGHGTSSAIASPYPGIECAGGRGGSATAAMRMVLCRSRVTSGGSSDAIRSTNDEAKYPACMARHRGE